jgi:hypothetical protein
MSKIDHPSTMSARPRGRPPILICPKHGVARELLPCGIRVCRLCQVDPDYLTRRNGYLATYRSTPGGKRTKAACQRAYVARNPERARESGRRWAARHPNYCAERRKKLQLSQE